MHVNTYHPQLEANESFGFALPSLRLGLQKRLETYQRIQEATASASSAGGGAAAAATASSSAAASPPFSPRATSHGMSTRGLQL